MRLCSIILLADTGVIGNHTEPSLLGVPSMPQGLNPKMMTRDAAPQHLLRMITCGCTKGCGNACICRTACTVAGPLVTIYLMLQ
ncbi:unnamed protein product [Parnassius mnemosyne]|uniref:Secreted protein n=1 Tax=Parnassius mnemosyne TaxID=213953 RepID=A0AAV1KP42_9NEOP